MPLGQPAQAIEALGLALERLDVQIIPDPVLLAELQAYEAERLPSGMLRYGAPPGMHDDTVMALAMAWQVVGGPVQTEQTAVYDERVSVSPF